MENSRSSRYAVTKKTGKVTSSSDKSLGGKAKKNVMKVEVNRPDSPEFFGFSNADIPQPIVIKTEPVEDAVDDDDCVVVEVSKGAKPIIIKKEKEDFDDMDTFHGFSLEDIPRPIVIKEEPQEDVSVERAETASIPEFFIKTTETLVENTDTSLEDTGTETLVETTEIIVDDTETTKEDLETPVSQKSTIPVDTLIDEFEMGGDPVVDAENNDVKNVDQENQDPESEIKIKEIVSVSVPSTTKTLSAEKSSEEISSSESSFVVIHDQEAKPVESPPQPKFVIKHRNKNDTQTLKAPSSPQSLHQSLPKKIQLIDQNGDHIELITEEAHDGEYDTDDTEEDHEFTVIVEDTDQGETKVTNITGDIHIDENNVIEADSIEDIIAQFETDSSNNPTPSQSVSCPNCKKCFVSRHFLNLHLNNNTTVCDLCNKQTCSQVALRNHKNLECDLSKRKRNIDLIAKETALLGRKPIEPEKYYNLPLGEDDEDEEFDDEFAASPPPPKKQKSINDAKRHGENAEKVIVEDDTVSEVVRCRHPGCDLFFNNLDEVNEHMKRNHSEEVKLACGMGGCDAVFDNRGALKRHRTDAHPELEEFKPVDLEPDDPERADNMTVACPVCERKFKHKNTCTVHIKTNHLGWSKRKLFECPDCFKTFDNKKAVELHREAVHLGIRTVCPLCEKPVTRLDLHVRMVHTELPEWPCPDCGKKFKRKFDLNRHRVTVHLGVRNFPCDLCGKRFADMKDMTRHKNAVHYGMKIKWNSRKYKEKNGKLKPKKQKEETENYSKRKQKELKLEESNVTYIETVETTGEEIIAMGDLEGSTVILDNGTVIQSHLEAVKGAPGEPQVFIEADPDNNGAYRFVVMTEDDAESGLETETVETVEVR